MLAEAEMIIAQTAHPEETGSQIFSTDHCTAPKYNGSTTKRINLQDDFYNGLNSVQLVAGIRELIWDSIHLQDLGLNSPVAETQSV